MIGLGKISVLSAVRGGKLNPQGKGQFGMEITTKRTHFEYLADKIDIIGDCLKGRLIVGVELSHTYINFFRSFDNMQYVRDGVPRVLSKFTVVQLDEKSKLCGVARKTLDRYRRCLWILGMLRNKLKDSDSESVDLSLIFPRGKRCLPC